MTGMHNRLAILLLTLTISACGGDSSPTGSFVGGGGSGSGGGVPGDGGSGSGSPTGVEGTLAGVPQSEFSRQATAGGNFLSSFDTVLDNTFRSVNPDQIPALTDPDMVDASGAAAGYITEDELVLGVVINGEARAYPHQIGWYHKIVNDIVGGQAVVVSFCPLTSTGMLFDGQVEGGRLTCGVSGFLFNNNLVMYDRRDPLNVATLYPQMMGVGVFGQRTNTGLIQLPIVETTWRYWKELFPNSTVVGVIQSDAARFSPSTNLTARQFSESTYLSYPYADLNYRDPDSRPLIGAFPNLTENPTAQIFQNKDMVHGVRFGEIAKAYPFKLMGEEAVLNDTVGETYIVVNYYAEEKLAISFFREFEGQTLTFEKIDSTTGPFPFLLRDVQTSTTWDLLGRGIEGPHAGKRLTQVPANNAFWFAWATFWQNTGIL